MLNAPKDDGYGLLLVILGALWGAWFINKKAKGGK